MIYLPRLLSLALLLHPLSVASAQQSRLSTRALEEVTSILATVDRELATWQSSFGDSPT